MRFLARQPRIIADASSPAYHATRPFENNKANEAPRAFAHAWDRHRKTPVETLGRLFKARSQAHFFEGAPTRPPPCSVVRTGFPGPGGPEKDANSALLPWWGASARRRNIGLAFVLQNRDCRLDPGAGNPPALRGLQVRRGDGIFLITGRQHAPCSSPSRCRASPPPPLPSLACKPAGFQSPAKDCCLLPPITTPPRASNAEAIHRQLIPRRDCGADPSARREPCRRRAISAFAPENLEKDPLPEIGLTCLRSSGIGRAPPVGHARKITPNLLNNRARGITFRRPA